MFDALGRNNVVCTCGSMLFKKMTVYSIMKNGKNMYERKEGKRYTCLKCGQELDIDYEKVRDSGGE